MLFFPAETLGKHSSSLNLVGPCRLPRSLPRQPPTDLPIQTLSFVYHRFASLTAPAAPHQPSCLPAAPRITPAAPHQPSCTLPPRVSPLLLPINPVQGWQPDVVTYTGLISAFERGGQWRLALQVQP